MMTLTKDRTDISISVNVPDVLSQNLILNGPNELALKRILPLQSQNEVAAKQAKIARQEQKKNNKIKYPKELLVDLFMDKCPKVFGITKEQFNEIIAKSTPKEIEAMENMLANSRKLKWCSRVQKYSIHTFTAIILVAILNLIFHLGPIWITQLPMYIFAGSFIVSGPLLSILYILGLLSSFSFMLKAGPSDFSSWTYLRCRKYLKKLYKDNYFSHEILKEKIRSETA